MNTICFGKLSGNREDGEIIEFVIHTYLQKEQKVGKKMTVLPTGFLWNQSVFLFSFLSSLSDRCIKRKRTLVTTEIKKNAQNS